MCIDCQELLKQYNNINEKLEIINNCDFCNEYNISEADTISILIEPVLEMAGWDLHDIGQIRRANRAGRGSKQMFDIELYCNVQCKYPRIVIECKSLKSDEFNIDDIYNFGKLNGSLIKIKKNGKTFYENKGKDGVGQLRRCCAKWQHKFNKGSSIPVLTNGFDWVIFDSNKFLGDLLDPVRIEDIKHRSNLLDCRFEERIIDNLKND